jgi:hypothetical protein
MNECEGTIAGRRRVRVIVAVERGKPQHVNTDEHVNQEGSGVLDTRAREPTFPMRWGWFTSALMQATWRAMVDKERHTWR